MKLLLTFLVVAVGVCQGATFSNAGAQRCRYPSWKCDCKLIYDCDGDSEFPADVKGDPYISGIIKDLAPKDYPLEIPGKRWRRSPYQQEDYCEKECTDRMNAFLCINKDESFTDYSYSALCIKLFAVGAAPNGPFSLVGQNEPCCTIHLEYGREWCTPKWNKDVGTVRCLTRLPLNAGFTGNTAASAISHVFSAEGECTATDAASGDYSWCVSTPVCSP